MLIHVKCCGAPEKTASMYCHRFCTASHCSVTSLTVDSLPIQLETASRKGALYLQYTTAKLPVTYWTIKLNDDVMGS